MFDIANIKTAERMIELHHPKNPSVMIGIRVTIVSMSDPRMTRIKRSINDAKLRLDARGKNFKADEVEENQNELIFTAMTGWEWYNPTGKEGDEGFDPSKDAAFKGKKPEFNRANVLMILNEPGLDWFGNQINDAIADEKAFF